MDPNCSAQDVVRCHLCETPLPPLHCDMCRIDLCKACVGEHVLDDSRDHKMVPFKQRGSTPNYPNCTNHDKKQCEFYCKECDVPVCSGCILTNSHKNHNLLHSLDVIESKLKAVEKDVNELQNSIYPKYEEIVFELMKEKSDAEIHYEKLTITATQMGKELHQEIDILVDKRKTEINEMKTKHLIVLRRQEDDIRQTVSEITQSIADLKKLLDSKDVCLVSEKKPKNAQFRKLPSKLKASLPNFTPLKINRDQLTEQFSSLPEISFTAVERGNIMPTQEVGPSPHDSGRDEGKEDRSKAFAGRLGERPSWRDREREKEEEGGRDGRAWRPAGAREGGGWREREKQRSESWKKETSPTKRYDEEDETKGEGWRGERGPPREDRPPARGFSPPRDTWRNRGEDRVPTRDGGDRGGFGERRREDRDYGRGRDDRDFGRRDDREFGRRDDRDFGRRDDRDFGRRDVRDFGRRDDRDFGRRDDRDFGRRDDRDRDFGRRDDRDFGDRRPQREDRDFGDRRAPPREDRGRSDRDREGFSDRAPPREERDWGRGGGRDDRWGGGGVGEERRGGDTWRDRLKEQRGEERGGGVWRGGRDRWRERAGERPSWRDRERMKEEKRGSDGGVLKPAGASEWSGWSETQLSETGKKETNHSKGNGEGNESKGEGWKGEEVPPGEDAKNHHRDAKGGRKSWGTVLKNQGDGCYN